MRRYNVKLNAWTSPAVVEATNKTKAAELALRDFPACDCCGEPTHVESVTLRTEPVLPFTSVIVEVKPV